MEFREWVRVKGRDTMCLLIYKRGKELSVRLKLNGRLSRRHAGS